MIRRRDAQLLGHTVDLAHADNGARNTGGAPMHDHDDEDEEGDGDGEGEGEKAPKAYRGSNHGGSLASMEEGAVAPGEGREPSVSLSLSAAVSHSMAAATAGRGEAPLPPVVEEQQGQGASTGGGGLVVALMRTLRLDGGGGGGGAGEEEKPPPSSAPGTSKKKGSRSHGSRVLPQEQQEEGERGRGASSASSALSSSASSTRSRRVLGMDEPTAVAAALVAMSAFIYSLESVNVKLLGKDVGFWTISVWVRKFICFDVGV